MTAKWISEMTSCLLSRLARRRRGSTLHRHVQEAEQCLFRLAALLWSGLLRLDVRRILREDIRCHLTPSHMFLWTTRLSFLPLAILSFGR